MSFWNFFFFWGGGGGEKEGVNSVQELENREWVSSDIHFTIKQAEVAKLHGGLIKASKNSKLAVCISNTLPEFYLA